MGSSQPIDPETARTIRQLNEISKAVSRRQLETINSVMRNYTNSLTVSLPPNSVLDDVQRAVDQQWTTLRKVVAEAFTLPTITPAVGIAMDAIRSQWSVPAMARPEWVSVLDRLSFAPEVDIADLSDPDSESWHTVATEITEEVDEVSSDPEFEAMVTDARSDPDAFAARVADLMMPRLIEEVARQLKPGTILAVISIAAAILGLYIGILSIYLTIT